MGDDTSAPTTDELQWYLEQMKNFPIGCSAERERVLASRIQQGDAEARRELIESNLRLVVKFAKRFFKWQTQITLLELIQEGNLGLIRATEDFDPDKGRFTTYASTWIKQHIGRAYPDVFRMIRLPVHTNEVILRVQKAIDTLTGEYGYTPSPEQIAEYIDPSSNYSDPSEKKITKEKVEELLIWDNLVLSLDQNENPDADDPYSLGSELVNATFMDPEAYINQEIVCEQVEIALGVVNKKQRQLLRLYFNFDGDHEAEDNLKKCGERMGLTRERARQLREAGLAKMDEERCQWLS